VRIGVISAYPDEDWDARAIHAAAARRAEARLLAPTDFGARVDGETVITACGERADRYDLFLTPRAIGDRGDAELQIEIYRLLAESGARLVNDVRALLSAIDKLRSSWELARAGVATPRVAVAQDLVEARRAAQELAPVVAKPLYGSLGFGVERLFGDERLGELLARHGAIYLQEFVAGAQLDVRAFVVGARVEAAVARRPRPGEFRSNARLGGRSHEIALDGAAAQAAVRAAGALGLDYAGVDLLITDGGPLVLEVNGTPSFRDIGRATGRDMAAAIVDYALAQILLEERWRPKSTRAT
jgi:ribosomal protein S6--L-glutamate ligase